MYQSASGAAVPTLAATGAAVSYGVIGMWTLIIAGVALIGIARVLAKRRAKRSEH